MAVDDIKLIFLLFQVQKFMISMSFELEGVTSKFVDGDSLYLLENADENK